jgi:hypothetical protein
MLDDAKHPADFLTLRDDHKARPSHSYTIKDAYDNNMSVSLHCKIKQFYSPSYAEIGQVKHLTCSAMHAMESKYPFEGNDL